MRTKGVIVFLEKPDWDIRDTYFTYICGRLGIRPHASGIGAGSVDTFTCRDSACDLSRFGVYLVNHFRKYQKAFLFLDPSALERKRDFQVIADAPIPWEAYVIHAEKRFGFLESSEWMGMERLQAPILDSWDYRFSPRLRD